MEYIKCVYSAQQIVSAQNTLAIKRKKRDRRQRVSAETGLWLETQGQPSLTCWEFDPPRKDTEI